MTPPAPLTHKSLSQGVDIRSATDPHLASVRDRFGVPPLWDRAPGFPTLVHIILEQQVSLASARAAFDKLREASREITPEVFLTFSDEELKRIGFSRQKAGYCRNLAQAILRGEFDIDGLQHLEDVQVRSALINLKGIGPWTADIYLLMVLLRPDIWPSGDLALAVAAQRLMDLPARPTPQQLEVIASPWQPYRAVAARLLWHFYLST